MRDAQVKPVSTIAIVVFALVGLVHLHRLIFGWEVIVGETVVPIWTSAAAVVIAGALALLLWFESRGRSGE